jgi:hypothetical protein
LVEKVVYVGKVAQVDVIVVEDLVVVIDCLLDFELNPVHFDYYYYFEVD